MAMYLAIKGYCMYTVNQFFRDISVVNAENIPLEGPTIIYGNHNNQFVDGLLLVAQVSRQISFVSAAFSMRRNIIGPMLRASNAIPVERPKDLAKKGPGTISKVKDHLISGKNTKFSEIQVGSSITINKGHQLRITQIINDNEMITDSSKSQDMEGDFPYLMIPKLEYSQLYESVWGALKDNRCVGIFPEGGSHDRMELLPLKAGICIMALGAVEKYGIPVNIVPCGFNYYNPQNFRSKVIMEFGPAYRVPHELVDLYKINKKQAISQLLDNLQRMLKNVTTSCKTFDELSTLFLCRQLYTINSKKIITTKEKLQLNRRFARGFQVLASRPENKQAYEKLLKFNKFVKIYGFQIRKQTVGSYFFTDFLRFLVYLEKVIVRLAFALPGIIMMGPTTTLIAHLAEKQRIKCLRKSKVKIFGNDVVGSYKILLAMILFPFTATLNSTIAYYMLTKMFKIDSKKSLKCSILLAALLPFYSILLVKSYDSLGNSFVKLKFYFIRLFKRTLYTEFNRARKDLSKKIIRIVDEQGQQIFGPDQNRIIQANQIQQPSSSKIFISDGNLGPQEMQEK